MSFVSTQKKGPFTTPVFERATGCNRLFRVLFFDRGRGIENNAVEATMSHEGNNKVKREKGTCFGYEIGNGIGYKNIPARLTVRRKLRLVLSRSYRT